MDINVKQAYKIALDVLGDGLKIYCCTELEDSWIFGWAWEDGTNVMLPPIQVKKSGICDLWNREFSSFLESSDWLDKNGKDIPIEELEKMSE